MCIPGIPLPPLICIECGTDQNPCKVKVVGPTLAFIVGVASALVCWPASLFVGCNAGETGKKMLATPVKWHGDVNNSIPF